MKRFIYADDDMSEDDWFRETYGDDPSVVRWDSEAGEVYYTADVGLDQISDLFYDAGYSVSGDFLNPILTYTGGRADKSEMPEISLTAVSIGEDTYEFRSSISFPTFEDTSDMYSMAYIVDQWKAVGKAIDDLSHNAFHIVVS